jgi:hypothetical protein
MRKPVQIRTIFAELRRAAGPSVASGDLVRLAHLILRAYNTPVDDEEQFGRAVESRAFISLPVDEAMKDGGWRILEFELERSIGPDEIDADELANLRRYIERFLGPEWQQRIPPG